MGAHSMFSSSGRCSLNDVVPRCRSRFLTAVVGISQRMIPGIRASGGSCGGGDLDELPQLFNVARGQMSLIGPRPETPSVVARYEPWQHVRHSVKPGMTGLWQVVARGVDPMEERLDLDIYYAQSLCPALDLKILMTTATAVIARRGE